MADVEVPKVEEETPIKEVTKEVPVDNAAVTPDQEAEAPAADEAVAKEENGSAAEGVNGGTNGNGHFAVGSTETAEEAEDTVTEEVRKRKSEGVEVADATDGVSAEKKAKLEEKSEAAAEDGIEAPANGEAEVTA